MLVYVCAGSTSWSKNFRFIGPSWLPCQMNRPKKLFLVTAAQVFMCHWAFNELCRNVHIMGVADSERNDPDSNPPFTLGRTHILSHIP